MIKSKLINMDNSGAVLCSTLSNYVEADKYKSDKEFLQREIKTAGDLASSNHSSLLSLALTMQTLVDATKNADNMLNQRIESHIIDDLIVQEHLQKEILMVLRDSEITNRCQQRWFEASWFTRTFRKKYLEKEYNRISQIVIEKYKPQFDECEKLLQEMKQRVSKMMGENHE